MYRFVCRSAYQALNVLRNVKCLFSSRYNRYTLNVLSVQDEPHDKAFQAWLKENRTIACPTCGQGLQKQEGCNHLQCVSCALPVLLRPLASALLPTLLRLLVLCMLPVYRSVCSVLHALCAFSSHLFCLLCRSHMHYSLAALCLSLPAPAVVIMFWAFATFSTSSALKIPSCLASRLIAVCLIHLSCLAFCPLNCPHVSGFTLDAGAPAARATCVGCVARRLKQAHIGRPTRITGILNPPAMEARMMPEWTMPE